MAEMIVQVEALRIDNEHTKLKVVAWGNVAQELKEKVQINQSWLLEGRLSMNTLLRSDGLKEKKAELIVFKIYQIETVNKLLPSNDSPMRKAFTIPLKNTLEKPRQDFKSDTRIDSNWDTSPLVPDTLYENEDEIPF